MLRGAVVRGRVERDGGGNTGGPREEVLLGAKRVTMIVPWRWARPFVETRDLSTWGETIRRTADRFVGFFTPDGLTEALHAAELRSTDNRQHAAFAAGFPTGGFHQ